jgi:uncharacterized membrane protein YkoI
MDRKKLLIGAAIAILTLGVGGVAIATQQGEQEENIKGGSIAAPAGSDEEDEGAESEGAESEGAENEGAENEAAENEAEGKNLEGLAKIDRSAAERAALDAVPGEVREVELESESGFVVYEVEVAGNDGTLHEVIVDAGSGKVLAQ